MSSSQVQIVLTKQYGYVVLVGIGSVFLNYWLGMNVGRARRKFCVEYPTMYHPTHHVFNCIQRAHQNTLENYPQFLMLLFLGGLDSPISSAIAGAIWIIARVIFAKGYYTGEPKKRAYGAFGYFGLIALLFFSLRLSYRLLRYESPDASYILPPVSADAATFSWK